MEGQINNISARVKIIFLFYVRLPFLLRGAPKRADEPAGKRRWVMLRLASIESGMANGPRGLDPAWGNSMFVATITVKPYQ
jgi:hypothetical protein